MMQARAFAGRRFSAAARTLGSPALSSGMAPSRKNRRRVVDSSAMRHLPHKSNDSRRRLRWATRSARRGDPLHGPGDPAGVPVVLARRAVFVLVRHLQPDHLLVSGLVGLAKAAVTEQAEALAVAELAGLPLQQFEDVILREVVAITKDR